MLLQVLRYTSYAPLLLELAKELVCVVLFLMLTPPPPHSPFLSLSSPSATTCALSVSPCLSLGSFPRAHYLGIVSEKLRWGGDDSPTGRNWPSKRYSQLSTYPSDVYLAPVNLQQICWQVCMHPLIDVWAVSSQDLRRQMAAGVQTTAHR